MKTVVNGHSRLVRREETLIQIAQTYDVSHMTISRLKRSTQRPKGGA